MMEQAGSSELQFDRAEFKKPEELSCRHCRKALNEAYFTVNGIPFCETCTQSIQGSRTLTFEKFLMALAWGTGAAILGAIGWALARYLARGHELGLFAVGAGYLIGIAIQRGGGRVGGWQLQTLAMFLTYACIGISDAVGVLASPHDPAADLPFVVLVMLVAGPVITSIDGFPMGFIINAIAFYEAWRFNKRPDLTIAGPLRPNWLPEKLTPDPEPGVVASV